MKRNSSQLFFTAAQVYNRMRDMLYCIWRLLFVIAQAYTKYLRAYETMFCLTYVDPIRMDVIVSTWRIGQHDSCVVCAIYV